MIPSSHVLHGACRLPVDDTRWDNRTRIPCECGAMAMLDPPCTVTTKDGSRVEQHAKCANTKCKRRWVVQLPDLPATPDLPAPDNAQIPDNPAPEPTPLPPTQTVIPKPEEEPMSAPPAICPCPCGKPVKPGNKYASKGCVGRARLGKPLTPEARANVTAANQRRAQEPVQASFDQAALLVDGIDATLAYGPEVQEAAKQALKVFAQAQDSTIVPATDPYAIVAELARTYEPRLLRIAADLREQMEGAK